MQFAFTLQGFKVSSLDLKPGVARGYERILDILSIVHTLNVGVNATIANVDTSRHINQMSSDSDSSALCPQQTSKKSTALSGPRCFISLVDIVNGVSWFTFRSFR